MGLPEPKLSMNRVLLSAALLAGALLPTGAAAQGLKDVKPSKPLVLKQQGSFYVGGNTHFVDDAYTGSNPGRLGNSMINQMYVQFQKPENKTKQFPIVFVHGCCLSSKTWETTPDGRMGWYEYFTRKGFDTYMADQVGRARSGFDALQYNKVQAGAAPYTTNPRVLIATDKFAWDVFRFGDFATKTPWPDERFPMQTVGVGAGSTLTFYKQVLPDMTSTLTAAVPGCAGGNCGPVAPDAFWHSPASMAELANDLGGAILVGHSQSSAFPTRAALLDPRGVKGIIQLETGCFGNLTPANINVLKNIPILIMEGDHYPTARPVEPCPTEIAQLRAAGGDITYIHLPDIGMLGNSHMFMQDNNNLQIADVIIRWIDEHVKGGKRGNHDN
jgi:pimeloyl-ACP methyl ester carboxylesterase